MAEWLGAELERPRYTLSLVDAISIRLRRSYLWIYLILLVSWWLKVSTVVLEARTSEAQI